MEDGLQTQSYPRWATEDYPEAAEDFWRWVVSAQLSSPRIREFLNRNKDKQELVLRVMAQAKYSALKRLGELPNLVERAQVFALHEAEHENWYHMLPAEFDDIREMMYSMVDDLDPDSSTWRDVRYLAQKVLPALKSAGADPKELWSIPLSLSKARAAVPRFRQLIPDETNPHAPGEFTQEAQAEVLAHAQMISNPNVSVRDYREHVAQARGRAVAALDPIPGDIYILPDGALVVVRCPSLTHARAVEIALRSVVTELYPRDFFQLMVDVRQLMVKNGDQALEKALVDWRGHEV